MKRVLLSALIVVFSLSSALAISYRWLTAAGPKVHRESTAPPAVPVTVLPIRPTTRVINVSGYGSLHPWRQTTLAAQLTGSVTQLTVTEGARVRAGQLLVVIDEQDYQVQLQIATANVQQAALNYSSARARLEVAQTQLAIVQHNYKLVAREFERLQELAKHAVISSGALEKAERAHGEALRLVRKAEGEIRLLRLGVQAAQNASILARAQQQRARLLLAKTKVYAPYDGVVGLQKVALGDTLGPGRPLLTILEIKRLKLHLQLPASAYRFVQPGQAVQVYPRELSPCQGKVLRILPRVDPLSRNFTALVEVPNRGKVLLLPGMFARASITIRQYRKAIFVPRRLICFRDGQPYLMMACQDRACLRPVTLGPRVGLDQLITAGVAAHELVIDQGHQLVRDQERIRIVKGGQHADHPKLRLEK